MTTVEIVTAIVIFAIAGLLLFINKTQQNSCLFLCQVI